MSGPLDEFAEKRLSAFLDSFAPSTRASGLTYFRNDQVIDSIAKDGTNEYTSRVRGSSVYTIQWTMNGRDWHATCTCPVRTWCKHVFAAGLHLLEAHASPSTISRRMREGSNEFADRPGVPPRAQPGASEISEIESRIVERLGRPLNAPEFDRVRRIERAFERSRQKGHMTGWEWRELGYPFPGEPWTKIDLWPEMPKTLHEFWLYVAAEVHRRRLDIPEFLACITDLEDVERRLSDWRRTRNVDSWKAAMRAVVEESPDIPRVPPAEIRLRVAGDSAYFEYRIPGKRDFVPLDFAKIERLQNEQRRGERSLTIEGEALIDAFRSRTGYASGSELAYSRSADDSRVFRRMLMMPILEPVIVDQSGRPLQRIHDPLRWRCDVAPDPTAGYTLRLARANGGEIGAIRWISPGATRLVVAADAVYDNVPTIPEVLSSGREVVPGPILETAEGLEFLRRIGSDIPPAIAQKIKSRSLRPRITIAIEDDKYTERRENCIFTMHGVDEEGQVAFEFDGGKWKPVDDAKASVAGMVIVDDTKYLAIAVTALGDFGVKWPADWPEGRLRVTKKFPAEFAAWLQTLPREFDIRLEGELASFLLAPEKGNVKIEVEEKELDWFDLRVVVTTGDTTLTQAEIAMLVDGRGEYVRLPGKGWRRLEMNFSAEDDEQLARLGLSAADFTSEAQTFHALQLAEPAARKLLPEAAAALIERRAAEIKARVSPPVPVEITAELRPYQKEGFHFLAYLTANRFGGILADDMGLGKTLQALTWLVWWRKDGRRNQKTAAAPSLVVCPKSVVDNWKNEAAHFAKDLKVRIWSAKEIKKVAKHAGDADLHVVNYHQLRLVGEEISKVKWGAVILDEAQAIKNPSSITAEIARGLAAEERLVLTGTPIENRCLDLWSLMAFAMPGVLGNRANFARTFDQKDDPMSRRRLAARVRPFLLRRTKSQVAADLPDKVEEDLYCEMEGEQETLYKAELKRAQQLLLNVKTQKELAKMQFNFLTALLRLRQVCCHPKLVKKNAKSGGAKLEALLEHLEALVDEGEKVLVFSQFVEVIELISEAIKERGWKQFTLTGDTEDRGALVADFQSTEGPAVFLISLRAGGFGLNLTAASYVVLFDPWWNPAVETQAIDRTHRIGQTRKVIAHRLLIKNSVEEKIRRLQKQKSALADEVLGEERFAKSLTLDDLQFLFGDAIES